MEGSPPEDQRESTHIVSKEQDARIKNRKRRPDAPPLPGLLKDTLRIISGIKLTKQTNKTNETDDDEQDGIQNLRHPEDQGVDHHPPAP
jgi:hypothetical protein